MKSQAVFVDGSGMPGVSGEANVYRPATPGAILLGAAKLAGVVPARIEEGFPPSGGSGNCVSADREVPACPEVDMSEILFLCRFRRNRAAAFGLIVS
jgi:hypothetical protein